VPLRYFTGAGWNRSGQFADRAAWEAYVKAFAATAANPLRIVVGARP
jgi:unsaturated rhamnogalacturonyl hydrolase